MSMPLAQPGSDINSIIGTQLHKQGEIINNVTLDGDIVYGDNVGWKQAQLMIDGRWTGSLMDYGMQLDKGYWIWNSGPEEILTLVGAVVNQDRVITVKNGWNLIGTAYPSQVSFDGSRIAGGNGGPMVGGTEAVDDEDLIFASINGWKQCYLNSSDNTTFVGSLMDTNQVGNEAGKFRMLRGYWLYLRSTGGPWNWNYPKPY